MPSTLFDVIVFDFDGTLVRSAEIKRQVFFDVFPECCAAAVQAVLERDPDGSRHRVIPEMIAEAQRLGFDAGGLRAAELIEAYGARASTAVADADEMPGAGVILERAGLFASVYIASVTPHEALQRLLERRGWHRLVKEAFGFPNGKNDVVAMLLARHGIEASRLLVVGNGVSDREAAERNGCAFHPVANEESLKAIPELGDQLNV